MDPDGALVVERELLLLRAAVRRDPERVLELLHPDFAEYGSSGRVWDRSTVAAVTADTPRDIEATGLQARRLGPDAVLVTYTSHDGERRALRSSTWVREGGQWLLLFHQGTLLTDAPPPPGEPPPGELPGETVDEAAAEAAHRAGPDAEQRLLGGRNDGAVRVGATVRRRAGDQTPAVQALLRHLEAVGFTGAPRALGIDERGREVLTHLDGLTVGESRPWPAWAHSDAALVAAGRWLRAYHEAASSFVAPPDPRWFGGRGDTRPNEVVGHHDAAPYNAVWAPMPTAEDPDAGSLVGFIDWGLAHPALPLEDLAFVALTWVPLTARDVAAADGFEVDVDRFGADVDRGRRLRLLLDAYGWTGTVADVLAAVRQRAASHAAGLRAAARSGYGPAAELVAEGVADAFDRAVTELDASTDELAGS